MTKSFITSLAKCREGNMSMNRGLAQPPASHRSASEPQVTQSQTPDDDSRQNRGREGDQYPRIARAKPGRLPPKWGHHRVRGRHCVTASTTIHICSRLRYRWNSVHSGTSAELSACRPIEFRGEQGSNGLRQRLIVLRCP